MLSVSKELHDGNYSLNPPVSIFYKQDVLMFSSSKPYTFDRVFRLFISIVACIGVIWLAKYLADVLIPFVTAFLLAYLLNPLVNIIQKRIRYRGIAVFVALGLVFWLISMVGWLIAPIIRQEISRMSELLSHVAQDTNLAKRAVQYLPAWLWENIRGFVKAENMQEIQTLLVRDDIFALLQVVGKKVLPGIWSVIHGAASFVFALAGLFIIMLYLIFMLLDYQHLKNEWKTMIPPAWRESILEFISSFNDAMNRYFRAQALVALIVGILFAVGFSLIGLPMGILLGLFVGMLNMVPYLQILGFIPAGLFAVVMAIETGGSLWVSLGLTLMVFVVVQAVQDGLLTPKIMGKVTGHSPAMILLSVSVWGKLLGLLGLIIALPATCLFLAYYHRLIAPLKETIKRE